MAKGLVPDADARSGASSAPTAARRFHATSVLSMEAWYSASSSVNVGIFDISNSSRSGKMGMVVDAWASVRSSNVVVGCVAVLFTIFSLRLHNMINKAEKMNGVEVNTMDGCRYNR